MLSLKALVFPALGGSLILALAACSDGSQTSSGAGGAATGSSASKGSTTSSNSSVSSTGAGGGAHASAPRGYYFSADTATNAWIVTVVDPTAASPVVATISADELGALSGPAGNKKGPAWGDTLQSVDGKRMFANATNVDRVLVIETAKASIETVLTVGSRPLHIYNPNDNGEIWSHADGEGAFYIVDTGTLSVSKPVVAASKATGHGKLLYAKELGTHYFATNTNDLGGWTIDGPAHTPKLISLCAKPCPDDPATPVDESLTMCGGTHDKTYDPATNQAIFQCSGNTGGSIAIVNAATNTVVKDLVPLPVSAFAFTHHKEYNLVFDNATDSVGIWDGKAPGHDLTKFDAKATIPGNASGRGADFLQNDAGQWEAWIPESTGTKLVVLNLATMAQSEIEIGALSPPAGATSATRRGAIAGDWYFTNNDAGLVMVNVKTRTIVKGKAPVGDIQRVSAVNVTL